MRPNTNRRSRNRGNPRHRPQRQQTFESNGPNERVRGNARQVHEKYLTLARDAQSSGDRILAEAYLQHADHYYRISVANQDREDEYTPGPHFTDDRFSDRPFQSHQPASDDDDDSDGDDGGSDNEEANAGASGQGQGSDNTEGGGGGRGRRGRRTGNGRSNGHADSDGDGEGGGKEKAASGDDGGSGGEDAPKPRSRRRRTPKADTGSDDARDSGGEQANPDA